jgi:hypothetical protein
MIRKFKRKKFPLLVLLQENCNPVVVLEKNPLVAVHKHLHHVKLPTCWQACQILHPVLVLPEGASQQIFAHGLRLAWRSSSQQIRLDIQFVPSLLALRFQMGMSFKLAEIISSKPWPSPMLGQKMCISMRR